MVSRSIGDAARSPTSQRCETTERFAWEIAMSTTTNLAITVPFLPELTIDLKQEYSGGFHG